MELLGFYLAGALVLSIYNCCLYFSGSLDDLKEGFPNWFVILLGAVIVPLLWPVAIIGHILGRLFGLNSELW